MMKTRNCPRKTKIVCTIGPASGSPAALARLIRAGMDVARLNFSHGSYAEHQQKLDQIRALSRRLGRPVAVMQDLAGPKIRTGVVPEGGIRLQAGREFILASRKVKAGPAQVSVSHPGLSTQVDPGATILLADGAIELRVLGRKAHGLKCRVVRGGVLTSHKGVNIPSGSLKLTGFTSKDRADLKFGIKNRVDFIAMSFVRSAEDVLRVKNLLRRAGAKIPVIAKIEKQEAVQNLDAIVAAADGLMVARGDLGVEIPLERVPAVQKAIIRKANAAGKPVITATQMLLSMVSSARPTRAEVTDVANAILDGTDAVMLSEETAVGRYPTQAVATMVRIACATEESLGAQALRPEYHELPSIPDTISYSACLMAEDLSARAIITPTHSGYTTRLISRYRPKAPIIALSPSAETIRRLCLTWGAVPLHVPELMSSRDFLERAVAAVKKAGMVRRGDRVVVTAGLPAGTGGITNLIKLAVVE